MADPLSIAAGIASVVGTGLKIAVQLNTIVDTVRDAPTEMSHVAQQIEHLSDLLGFTFQLMEENEWLYRQRLTFMLRDIRWQFKIIQDVVEKCVSGNKRMKRLRWLFKSRRVGELMRKLEALKSTMMLTLQVAQLAEREVRESRIKDEQIASLQASAMTTVKRSRRVLKKLVEHAPLVEADDHDLVKYEQKPEDMAEWMAMTLSTPCVPLDQPTDRDVELASTFRRPLTEVPRPIPNSDETGSTIKFDADDIDVRALKRYGIQWDYEDKQDSEVVVIRENVAQKKLEDYEVDMIAGTSATLKIASSLSWTIDISPYLTLPIGMVVDRLLQDWTTLNLEQRKHIKDVSAHALEISSVKSESGEPGNEEDEGFGESDLPKWNQDALDSDDDSSGGRREASAKEKESIPEWFDLERGMISLLARMRDQYASMKSNRDLLEESRRREEEWAERLADAEAKLERQRRQFEAKFEAKAALKKLQAQREELEESRTAMMEDIQRDYRRVERDAQINQEQLMARYEDEIKIRQRQEEEAQMKQEELKARYEHEIKIRQRSQEEARRDYEEARRNYEEDMRRVYEADMRRVYEAWDARVREREDRIAWLQSRLQLYVRD